MILVISVAIGLIVFITVVGGLYLYDATHLSTDEPLGIGNFVTSIGVGGMVCITVIMIVTSSATSIYEKSHSIEEYDHLIEIPLNSPRISLFPTKTDIKYLKDDDNVVSVPVTVSISDDESYHLILGEMDPNIWTDHTYYLFEIKIPEKDLLNITDNDISDLNWEKETVMKLVYDERAKMIEDSMENSNREDRNGA